MSRYGHTHTDYWLHKIVVNVSTFKPCKGCTFVMSVACNEKQCSRQLQCEVPCSVAVALMSSILPCLSILPGAPCPPPAMLSSAEGGGVWAGSGQGGRGEGGQGTFWSSCHILHYHMVLRPKGTSHNECCTANLLKTE